jgi:uncharacterized protein (TIGR02284 family)
MERSNSGALGVLRGLYRIAEAGERGYAVAAANVNNRGLKVLFKSYARQRADFKNELFAEMQRVGAHKLPRGSLLAAIHRGRIDIFAALTIGAENVERVVVREVLLGEKVALRAYERALGKQLPSETREMVARQMQEVRRLVDEIRLMRGRDGQRLLVRLYDSDSDARRAIRRLGDAGFNPDLIQEQPVGEDFPQYEGRGTTLRETILAGGAGGAFWGTLIGLLAEFGVFQLPALGFAISPASQTAPIWIWALLALLMPITGGAVIGSLIGMFIGWGVADADAYVYDHSLRQGDVLVRLMADQEHASEAWGILARVNREALTREHAPAH